MRASIVVPSRAGAERLPVLLSALQRQTESDFEVIVVLDGDIDGSEALVRDHPLRGLRTIVFPENRGRVAALNAGFADATGEVLIRCDDDLEPGPEFVSEHIKAHEELECGVVGIYRNVMADTPYARAYGRDADRRFREAAYRATPDQRWLYWAGNCSVTRTMWDKVGPYDVRFRAYGWEDVDYGLRLHEAGYPIVLRQSLETTHHAAASTTEARVRRAYRSGQAKRLFDKIHDGIAPAGLAPTNDSVWNVTKNVLQRALEYDRARRASGIIDRALPFIPRMAATKLVALLVEAAAIAGYADQKDAANDF
ncbi:glycosyltransferase family 2 protein [Dermacoccus nishinomiyaensis]|uniref:glycosyltransferase family 2 protein n=1 Tax=Dermacoccus nishinomiyaensis TaxID=1274 RepID=UPI000DFACC37|nr:glycosyltransferase [Dermacoccus nishinomiyaensis]QQY24204.1 glycosyltransferase family 2 protein [Dermacoccus nishinomiyaensis]STD71262.1 Undecaprenyl-phosphate 4-deoxy-4-formamido-L-arabinose transferase [Dermacoccus nishinomiyaensis]STD71438.1 Undecaprenyl-phosphate 4-deoxy-4-formamido-L-arabinose transferase [Dermacoccus nishinomiyaensis]